jgi:5-methylcytosine-specific restriction enzyme A
VFVRPPDNKRLPAHLRGYDADWHKRSKEFLAAHPVCEDCGGRATDADHVPSRRILIERGVANPDADIYLHPRCHSCHSAKTSRDDGGFGRKKVGVSKS